MNWFKSLSEKKKLALVLIAALGVFLLIETRTADYKMQRACNAVYSIAKTRVPPDHLMGASTRAK